MHELPQATTKIKTSLSEQVIDTGVEKEDRNTWQGRKSGKKMEKRVRSTLGGPEFREKIIFFPHSNICIQEVLG